MTDKEVIEKVIARVYFSSSYLGDFSFESLFAHPYYQRVLVRFTRRLERAKWVLLMPNGSNAVMDRKTEPAWRDREGRTVLGAGD